MSVKPEQKWPGRVVLRNGAYLVDNRWAVIESGQRWDAYDPDAADRDEPVGGFKAGAATAAEKIRELIGEPE